MNTLKIDYQVICKKIKERIEKDSEGLEFNASECEIIHHGVTYCVTYEVTREYNTTFTDFDEDEDKRCKMNITINGCLVFDKDSNPVHNTYHAEEITRLFTENTTF